MISNRIIIFLIAICWLVGCVPNPRGNLVFEPSYTHLSFDLPLGNTTSPFTVVDKSLFMFTRRCNLMNNIMTHNILNRSWR